MKSQETDQIFDAEVTRIKRMAIQRSKRVNWSCGILLLVALVVSIAAWFTQDPIDRDGAHLRLCLGLGFATFCLGGIFCRFLFPIPRAQCPQCGCDWNVESDNDMQKWLSWHSCPVCGLQMGYDGHEKS